MKTIKRRNYINFRQQTDAIILISVIMLTKISFLIHIDK